MLEGRFGRPIEELVRDLYEDQGLTLADAAAELGIGESTLSRWLGQLGIAARPPGNRKVEA